LYASLLTLKADMQKMEPNDSRQASFLLGNRSLFVSAFVSLESKDFFLQPFALSVSFQLPPFRKTRAFQMDRTAAYFTPTISHE
jgi:hypothetical protein